MIRAVAWWFVANPVNTGFQQVIISLPVLVLLFGPFKDSLISLRKTVRFCVKRSRFLTTKFRSIPSMRVSNHCAMLACFSGGWFRIIFSRSCPKYWNWIQHHIMKHGLTNNVNSTFTSPAHFFAKLVLLTSSLSRISPNKGLDMDHWLRQSSNITMFNTVSSICCRISGCCSTVCSTSSLLTMVNGRGCFRSNQFTNKPSRNAHWFNFQIYLKISLQILTFLSPLFEQIRHNVIKGGAATGTNHCV